MNIAILTREYPPHVYGGAGVHVEYLTRELARSEHQRHNVQVLCFGDQHSEAGNLRVQGIESVFSPPFQDDRHRGFMDFMVRDIMMAGSVREADIVHCHTWYTHLAGCLVKHLVGARLVLTTHSLEPHRPWKVEQLGTAYHASSWIERTTYTNADGVIAVSESMRRDVHELYEVPENRISVIHNGIDLNQYRPTPNPDALRSYDIDPDTPYVLFVGRITRQKGIIHLVNALKHVRPGITIVLCAGAPDTEEIGREMAQAVDQARAASPNKVIWIPEIVPKDALISIYTHATIFVCPSVYEPFGIINLEAMACETPVVASAVGGIPEVVIHGETGLLVAFDPRSVSDFEPREPDRFSSDLASAMNTLLASPERIREMGRKSRERVVATFSWSSIAQRTLEFYRTLMGSAR